MGYSYRNNGQITDFWPDTTSTELYICCDYSYSLRELMDLAASHFPGIPFNELSIDAEKIHTTCLSYDLYDPSDYTQFIVIRKK